MKQTRRNAHSFLQFGPVNDFFFLFASPQKLGISFCSNIKLPTFYLPLAGTHHTPIHKSLCQDLEVTGIDLDTRLFLDSWWSRVIDRNNKQNIFRLQRNTLHSLSHRLV